MENSFRKKRVVILSNRSGEAFGLHPLRETKVLSIKVEHFQKGDVPNVEYPQEVFQRIQTESCSSL